mgnify:CR=1 FL=1
MKSLLSPIAARAYRNALKASQKAPAPRLKADSRTADKFVVRGYRELFNEIKSIGLHQGRSSNSEMVAAVLGALSGFDREIEITLALKERLGEALADDIVKKVPKFDLKLCTDGDRFTIRFPPEVRETVRIVVLGDGSDTSANTMNAWFLNALVSWVDIQSEQYALVSASMSIRKAHAAQKQIEEPA